MIATAKKGATIPSGTRSDGCRTARPTAKRGQTREHVMPSCLCAKAGFAVRTAGRKHSEQTDRNFG